MRGIRRRSRRAWWWSLGVVGVGAVVLLSTTAASGAFSASVKNVSDRVQSASLITSAAVGGTNECDLSAAAYTPVSAANTAPCTGTLLPSGTVPATGTSAVSTVVTDKGSVSASAAALTMGTCGPVLLANSVAASDPMLIRGNTVSYAQTGPLTGGTGLGLSGGASGTGYAAEVTAATGPGSFSEAIWFKTTGNGTLMGFSDTPTATSPTSWDHMLWVDATGHVVFGVTTILGSSEATSAAGGYNNGQWHLAVGTLNALAGMSITVDGVNTSNAVTLLGALTYTGYWHVGWDNESAGGWLDPPTTPYFGGTLADAAIFPALSAAQVSALFAAGSQAAWNTLLTSDAATSAWMLGDSGATPFTGVVPKVTPAACNFVDVTVGATASTCAAPINASAACAAPSAALRFGGLGASLTITPPPTITTPLTITITIARDPTNTVAANPYALGLHLTATKALVASNSSFSATLNWPAENVIL